MTYFYRLVLLLLMLPGIIAFNIPASTAQARSLPSVTCCNGFDITSPSEIGRKFSQTLNNLKEGLHPILVLLIYAGLAFLGFIAFAVFVMIAFFLVMVLRRH